VSTSPAVAELKLSRLAHRQRHRSRCRHQLVAHPRGYSWGTSMVTTPSQRRGRTNAP